jgi:hypothetical protein
MQAFVVYVVAIVAAAFLGHQFYTWVRRAQGTLDDDPFNESFEWDTWERQQKELTDAELRRHSRGWPEPVTTANLPSVWITPPVVNASPWTTQTVTTTTKPVTRRGRKTTTKKTGKRLTARPAKTTKKTTKKVNRG